MHNCSLSEFGRLFSVSQYLGWWFFTSEGYSKNYDLLFMAGPGEMNGKTIDVKSVEKVCLNQTFMYPKLQSLS